MACNRDAHKKRLEQTAFQRLKDINMVSSDSRDNIGDDMYVPYEMNFYSVEKLQEMADTVNKHVGTRAVVVYQNKRSKAKYLKIKIPTDMVEDSIENEETLPDLPPDENGQLSFFSPSDLFQEEVEDEETTDSDTLGQEESLKSLAKFKSELIAIIKNRINTVVRSIDKLKDDLKNNIVTKTEYDRRILELRELMVDLKGRMSGKELQQVKGLYDEMQEIKSNTYLLQVTDLMLSDIERAEKLSNSTDPNDILEALHILQYYSKINDLTDKDVNQMLAKVDLQEVAIDMKIVNEAEKAGRELSEDEKKENLFWTLNQIAMKAQGVMYNVSKAETNIIVEIFNNNRYIREMFPERFIKGEEKPFTEDEVFEKLEGMDDAKWYDALVNLTSSLSGNITLYEQVMFTEAMTTKIQEEYLAKEVEETITGMVNSVNKKLKSLKLDMSIFMDKTVGEMRRRFSGSFYAELNRVKEMLEAEINRSLKQGTLADGDSIAIEALKRFAKWAQKNVYVIDNDSFPELSASTETRKSETVKKLLGEKGYDSAIEEQRKLNEEFIEALAEKEVELMMRYNVENISELPDIGVFELEKWRRTYSPDYFMKTFLNPNLLSKSDETLEDRIRAGLVVYQPVIDETTGLPKTERKAIIDPKTGKPTGRYEDVTVTKAVAIQPLSDYAYMVPRKKKFDATTGKETDIETGFHSEEFKIIEENPELLEFYNNMIEALRRIYHILPHEVTKDMTPHSLWLLNNTFLEILKKANKDKAYGAAILLLFERFFVFMGKQFGRKMYVTSPETGSYYNRKKLNASEFTTHSDEISQRFRIEFSKLQEELTEDTSEVRDFLPDASGTVKPVLRKVKKRYSISRDLKVRKNKISQRGISLLMNMLRETGGDTRLLEKNMISVGEILYAYATVQVVNEKSFNLPKMIIAMSHAASAYAGAAKIEPSQVLMQEGAKKIKAPARDLKDEIREKAEKGKRVKSGEKISSHMDLQVWNEFDKPVSPDKWHMKLPNISKYARELTREFDEAIARAKMSGAEKTIDDIRILISKGFVDGDTEAELAKVIKYLNRNNKKKALEKIREILARVGKEKGEDSDIYTEIESIKNSVEIIGDYRLVKQFEKDKESIATYLTIGGIGDAALSFWRFAGLAVNVGAMYTNVLAGIVANATMAQLGTRFSPSSYYRAMQVTMQSPTRYLTRGRLGTPGANKTSVLMNRYRILQDVSNELQKAENRLAFSGILSNPYVLVVRGEYMVQSPILVAMMMDYQITGENGQTSSAWDAIDKNGKLKEGFRTPKNIQTWEQASSDEASGFIGKVTDAVVAIQGDYSKYSGTQAGRNNWVRAAFMFKKWMAMQIHQRRAGVGILGKHTPHANLMTGQKDFLGRHSQLGIGYGAAAGAMGMVTQLHISMLSAGIGAGLGVVAAFLFGKGKASYRWNISSIATLGAELVNMVLGPLSLVNYVVGSKVVPLAVPRHLTETEKGNFRANAMALTQQLVMYLATHALANAVLGKCEDEKEMSWANPKKYACRSMKFVFNKTQSLVEEMYLLDSLFGYSDITNTVIPIRKIIEVIDLSIALYNHYEHDKIYYEGGKNIGKSKVKVKAQRVFGMSLTSDWSLGLDRASKELWMSKPMSDFYEADEYKVAKAKYESFKAQLKGVITIEENLTEYKGEKMSFLDRERLEIYNDAYKPAKQERKDAKKELDEGLISEKEYKLNVVRINIIEKKKEEKIKEKIDAYIERELRERLEEQGVSMRFPSEFEYYRDKYEEEADEDKIDAISGAAPPYKVARNSL